MAAHPPSTLYDRIEEAHLLSDEERARLSALAERIWSELPLRTSRADKAALERAFWSLIGEWESLPAVVEESSLPTGFGMERVRELENRLGESFVPEVGTYKPATVDLSLIHPDEEVLFDFPRQLARKFGVFPVRKQERLIELASATPLDWKLWLDLAIATGWRIRLLFAPGKEIERAIKRFYPDAREATPPPPLRLLLNVRNPETLAEEGYDIEFGEMEVMSRLTGDLVGRLLSEGIDSVMIEPTDSAVQLNVFSDAWRPLATWPRNLWRPLDLAFRRRAHVPNNPWEAEATLNWPFMGTDFSIWLMWKDIEGTQTITIQPFQPSEADE